MKLSDMKKLEKESLQNKKWIQDIVLTRISNNAETNIEQKICYHSPTGFEWGYGGSGPAELALNILYLFLDFPRAWKLHQLFKWQVISNIPKWGGKIKVSIIKKWIKENL